MPTGSGLRREGRGAAVRPRVAAVLTAFVATALVPVPAPAAYRPG